MTTRRDRVIVIGRSLEEAIILLEEASETLDNYSDVVDGDDGQPRANGAMATKARIDAFLGEA